MERMKDGIAKDKSIWSLVDWHLMLNHAEGL